MSVVTQPVPASTENDQRTIFSARFLWITIGIWSLEFFVAFENLAVTTVMPLISRELDGASLYTLAFSGPLAIGVVGMVVVGCWADRGSSARALIVSILLFAFGLIVAGTATSMWMFLAGRLIHGFGGGALTVAFCVTIAHVYPARLHPAIFGTFAAAWVLPSLVGPVLAGVVAELVGWNWVFLGVVALVMVATVLLLPGLRMLKNHDARSSVPWNVNRIVCAVFAAIGVLALNFFSELSWPLAWVIAATGVCLTFITARSLFPAGALRAVRGLPSVIFLRGLVSGAFCGAEVYVPCLLKNDYGLSAALAGLALTGAALAWSVASWLQGRLVKHLSHALCILLGLLLLGAGIATTIVTTFLVFSFVLPIIAWMVVGAGMGLLSPRLRVLALAFSAEEDKGFNSSAMSISDALGAALTLAVTSVIAAVLVPVGGSVNFTGVFVVAFVAFLGALLVARRALISA